MIPFSDGVCAIAIALLALALEVPEHLSDESMFEALWRQRDGFLAYALSFAVIGRFWLVHHRREAAAVVLHAASVLQRH
jgi:uncharacterized membrane protein